MRCDDPQWHSLPIARRRRQEPLPHAWRGGRLRRPEGQQQCVEACAALGRCQGDASAHPRFAAPDERNHRRSFACPTICGADLCSCLSAAPHAQELPGDETKADADENAETIRHQVGDIARATHMRLNNLYGRAKEQRQGCCCAQHARPERRCRKDQRCKCQGVVELVDAIRSVWDQRRWHQSQHRDYCGQAEGQDELGGCCSTVGDGGEVHLAGSAFGLWIRMPGASSGVPMNSIPADSRVALMVSRLPFLDFGTPLTVS